MEQRARSGVAGRFLGYGATLGAVTGFATTGVTAAWALGASTAVDLVAALLLVAIGAAAGSTIGIIAAAVAAAAYAALLGRASRPVLGLTTIAVAAAAAGGCWLVASRTAEWMQSTWMVLAVGLGAGALAAVALPRIIRVDPSTTGRLASWVIGGAVVCGGLGIAGAGTAGAGTAGVGPLASQLGVVETQVMAVTAVTSGNPRALQVGVRWSEDGYCTGQFTVQVAQGSTEVRLSEIVSQADRRYWNPSACVGLGTVDGLAWLEVELAEPLGERIVLDGDGNVLPVRSG